MNLNFAEVRARASVLPNQEVVTDIWKAAMLASTTTADGSELSLWGVSRDAEAIILRVKAAS